jgi:DNA mismatch repair protein MutL
VLALTRPGGLPLTSDGRAAQAAAGRLIDRIHALWGRELADTLLEIAHRHGTFEITGFAQRPSEARPAGRKGYVFVRGRPVNPFILRAAEAVTAPLSRGDRPTLILFLDLPGDAVDVNVHPAKAEVRFRDRFLLEQVVWEGVRAALAPLEAAATLAPRFGSGVGPPVLEAAAWEGTGTIPAGVPRDLFAAQPFGERPRGPELLQVFDTYLVFQADDGVVIVDQHSAHERVLYEGVMRQLGGDGAPAQRLLLPLTLEFTAPELEAIDAHRELLQRVGYELEPFSGRTVVVHTAPNPHPRFEAARCLQELVGDLAGGRFGGWANRLERFAASFACRAAVKAGHR